MMSGSASGIMVPVLANAEKQLVAAEAQFHGAFSG
jgi:hypothetical protein